MCCCTLVCAYLVPVHVSKIGPSSAYYLSPFQYSSLGKSIVFLHPHIYSPRAVNSLLLFTDCLQRACKPQSVELLQSNGRLKHARRDGVERLMESRCAVNVGSKHPLPRSHMARSSPFHARAVFTESLPEFQKCTEFQSHSMNHAPWSSHIFLTRHILHSQTETSLT